MRREVRDGRPWVCTEAEQRELDGSDRACRMLAPPTVEQLRSTPAVPGVGGGIVFQVVNTVDPARPTLAELDPCRAGAHRPAYLARGGVACGRCGVRLG